MNRTLHGFGLGLRPQHYAALLGGGDDAVDWLEIVSENFLVDGGRPLAMLDRFAERWPLAMHGVALDIGGSDPLDRDYLRALAKLAKRVRPAIVSDHLCWSRHRGVQLHDLLPLPQTGEAVRHVAARVRAVQDALGMRLALENVSSYLRFAGDEMDEAAFLKHLADFRENTKVRYPFAVGTAADMKNYGITGIPTVFVLDKEGRVTYAAVGGMKEHLLNIAIDRLLKKPVTGK